jgi:glycosyltransferase involved in cell wall biosynthesis
MPRYWWGKALASQFDKRLFLALRDKADLILASADNEAINTLVDRSNGALDRKGIVQFPTRIDTAIFKIDRAPLTSNLRASAHPTFVTCGRINRVKGWELILDAFGLVRKKLPSAKLYFVGDGEDTSLLKSRAAKAGILDATTITGFKSPKEVAKCLNSVDVFVLGSYREGWPNALLEALACGLPIVATDVSSVKEVILPGLNGYIVANRDPVEYASKMLAALQLQCPNTHSVNLARHYSIDTLEHDLASLWEPLRR